MMRSMGIERWGVGAVRPPHVVGLLAWLGVTTLVVRSRLDGVLAVTHPPNSPSYDVPLVLTPSWVDRAPEAVAAWQSLPGVAGLDIARLTLLADGLGALWLLAAVAVALHVIGRLLKTATDPGRKTVGKAARVARWFAIAALVLRILGDIGTYLLLGDASSGKLSSSWDVLIWVLVLVEGFGIALAAAALVILVVAAAWAVLGHADDSRVVGATLLSLRVHVAVVVFFGALVLAPIMGPQLDDVILRWWQEGWDAVVAAVAMAWLGVVLLVVTDQQLVRERYPPRNMPLLLLFGVGAVVAAVGFLLVPGLRVLGGILALLALLSWPFHRIDDGPPRSGGLAKREALADSLVPVVLAVGPISMLGIAVVRAAAGEAGLSGGAWWLFVVGGAVVPPLAGLMMQWRGVRRAPLWPVVVISGLLSVALAIRIVNNPWRVGDALGVIGTFACFAVVLSLLGFVIALADRRWRPPPLLLALGQRRLPILAILALWAAGAAALPSERGYHDVRMLALEKKTPERVDLSSAWQDWLQSNELNDVRTRGARWPRRVGVPLVFVAASGGGIRAAYWTARVVDCAIDRWGRCDGKPRDTRNVFAASGTSGGSLGLATWAAHRMTGDDSPGRVWVDERLGEDYFAPAWARTLFADLPETFLQLGKGPDRAAVLERAWEQSWTPRQTSIASLLTAGPQPSTGPLTERLLDLRRRAPHLPLLLFGGTSVTDGCRTNTSRLRGDALKEGLDRCTSPEPFAAGDRRRLSPRAIFGATRDVFDACDAQDVRLSTGALLSARFPVISSSGHVKCGQRDELQIVDGGYFDNSAASPVQELWARLAPLVDAFNRRAKDRCVVPVMLQIDNHYVNTAPAVDARPQELAAPLLALLKSRAGRAAGAEQATAIAFSRRQLDDGSVPTAPRVDRSDHRTLERYAQIYPRVQPGAQAPLGWTLSVPSRESLEREVESSPNARALRQVQRWFKGSLRCR